ncbi:hypothetical protein CWB99_22505 [Pseudoalteromonas rubra]|uniref:Uncharacterized protein n=1 Tax=Pseudoalteromonas rubra TaxID=43658 RepID=A0A5S3WHC2_9GAMM|nr:hypothetical protein [Pseudoalteromonas rubra]TMP24394.1 hypothetical protein CWB99_22505 [Pseudoalteromonas rubra]TMP30883.1 hypothetical protein CWC00_15720 [Pseudoalteromonas rubra]
MKLAHQSGNAPQVAANNTSAQPTTGAPKEMRDALTIVAKQQLQSVPEADQQVLNSANLSRARLCA